MNVLLALPLILLAAEAPPIAPEGGGALMTYAIRVVDCGGLGWRSEFQSRLSYSGYERGKAAWIAEDRTIAGLVDFLRADPGSTVIELPDLSAVEGSPAVLDSWTSHHMVIHAEQALEVADADAPSRPIVAPISDGAHIELAARRTGEGVRLGVNVLDSRIAKVHVIETTPAPESCPEGAVCVTYRVQAPEVYSAEVKGEWSIPEGSGLIVSLGIRSDVQGDDAEHVRERLILITPNPDRSPTPEAVADRDPAIARTSLEAVVQEQGADDGAPAGDAIEKALTTSAPRSLPWFILPFAPFREGQPEGREIAAMPKAMVPSRSLPSAVTPDGEPIAPIARDDDAEQADYRSFVDGRPVPTPQVTSTAPDASIASKAEVDPDLKTASATGPTAESISIAISYNFFTGFGFKLERSRPIEHDQEASTIAAGGEPDVRR